MTEEMLKEYVFPFRSVYADTDTDNEDLVSPTPPFEREYTRTPSLCSWVGILNPRPFISHQTAQ